MRARKRTENTLIAFGVFRFFFLLFTSLRIGLAIKMSSCSGLDGKGGAV